MILPLLRKVSTALSTAATTALGLSDLCFCLTVLSGRISSLTWTTRGSRQSWMEEVVICICEGSFTSLNPDVESESGRRIRIRT